jgi:DNA-3-methyladenine glycosylase
MENICYYRSMLSKSFFNRDPETVAKALLGKVMLVKYHSIWLSASIIETEAYYLTDKASHASLGFTEKRRALFMPAGTIYMYYSRAGDSLNISAKGEGNAVLIKSGLPYIDENTDPKMLAMMQKLNPAKDGSLRPFAKLCRGQTLLCKSLNLKVKNWDQQQFDPEKFYINDVGYKPKKIIITTRLGIRKGRDEHLQYRFIDHDRAQFCTKNPLAARNGNYTIIANR